LAVIVVPSLNTARDVILGASGWHRGAVGRADKQYVVPGGKPLNVARFLGAMGVPCLLIALADTALAAETARILPPRVSAELFVTAASSRTDVAIVEAGGRLTVITGPAPPVSTDELDTALDAVGAGLGERDLLIIAGSQPPGAVERLLEIAQRASARLLVDASGADLLTALGGHPEVVKVNAAELAAARGGDAERAWRDAPALLPEAANVVVTHGRRGLRGWLGGRQGGAVRVPAIQAEVVNPYGAGDAVTAALAAGMLDGPPTVAALLDGAAWAAAVAGEFGIDLDPGKAATLREQARAIREGSGRG
jgi:fructose-1-phosphate kinase PfkB-like protein